MPKGVHTAGFAVLFERAPSLEAIEENLRGFKHRRAPANIAPGWMSSGRGLVADLFPSINGRAAIDVFDGEWPDHMGDPKGDVMLFGSWSMGFFGPFTFRGTSSAQCSTRTSFSTRRSWRGRTVRSCA